MSVDVMSVDVLRAIADDLGIVPLPHEDEQSRWMRTLQSSLRFQIQAACIDDGYGGTYGVTPSHARERTEHWLAGVERYMHGTTTIMHSTSVTDAMNVLLWSGDLVEENGLYRCTRAGWRVFNPRLRAVTGFVDVTDLPAGMVVSGMGILQNHDDSGVDYPADKIEMNYRAGAISLVTGMNPADDTAGLPWKNAQPLGDGRHIVVSNDAITKLSQRERAVLDYCGWKVDAGVVVRWW